MAKKYPECLLTMGTSDVLDLLRPCVRHPASVITVFGSIYLPIAPVATFQITLNLQLLWVLQLIYTMSGAPPVKR